MKPIKIRIKQSLRPNQTFKIRKEKVVMLEINKLKMNKLFFWIDVYSFIGSLIICIMLFFKNGIDVSFIGWFCVSISTLNVIFMQLQRDNNGI